LSTQDLIAYMAALPPDDRAQILSAMMAPPGIPVEASADVPAVPKTDPPPPVSVRPPPTSVRPPLSVRGPQAPLSPRAPLPPASVAPPAPASMRAPIGAAPIVPPARDTMPSAIDIDLDIEVEHGGASVSAPPAYSRSIPPPPPSRPATSISTLPAPPELSAIVPTPVMAIGSESVEIPITTGSVEIPVAVASEPNLPGQLVAPEAHVPPPPTSIPPPPTSLEAVWSAVASSLPPASFEPAPVPVASASMTPPPVSGFVPAPAPAAFPLTQAEPIPLNRPQSAVDVIDLLFDAMEDLPFLETALEASAFCLSAALRVLPSRAGMVHLYDINTREFITVYTQGENTEKLLMARTPETDALFAAAMGRHRAMAFRYDRGGSPRDRHTFFGPPRSVLTAPAMVDGRYLGIIELIDPMQGGIFDERAENAISYVADRFAEFLSQHGIGIGQIVAPPPSGMLNADDDVRAAV